MTVTRYAAADWQPKVGFEAHNVTVAQYAMLGDALEGALASSVEWVDTR